MKKIINFSEEIQKILFGFIVTGLAIAILPTLIITTGTLSIILIALFQVIGLIAGMIFVLWLSLKKWEKMKQEEKDYYKDKKDYQYVIFENNTIKKGGKNE